MNTNAAIDGVTSTKFLGSEDGSTYDDIPETKTFYPTVDEFSSPVNYIQSIRDEGMRYGIIKIKPPKEWNPKFNLSFDDFKFSTKIQPIHLIEKRITGGSLSCFALTELRSRFLANLRTFLDDMNIDDVILNKKKVYLYDLYTKVTVYGGYFKINNDKIWDNVATELGVEYVGNTHLLSSHLVKLCYELYLLDYEQTHNFPGLIKDLNQYPNSQNPKEKYKNILINKPQQVRKIQRCNTSNMNDINQFQTCSVCGQFPDSYNVTNVILECIQCGNRWHSKCHEPPIPLQQLHLLLNSANGTGNPVNWSCTNCTIQRTAKFGYHSSGKVYSLNEYKQKADLFQNNYLKAVNRPTLTPTEWEHVFWSIVDNGCCPLSIEYGSEIPSTPEMTGFPMDSDEKEEDGSLDHVTHDFNLMNIKNAKGNILKHLDRDISGMTYPWIYVGMLFTSFGWHYEDHYSYSVNYNHYGNTKQWYGIPPLHAGIAEDAMKEFLNGTFEQFDLVTLVSPLVLHKKYGIPIYKARQLPGEFIVTFPQNYHCGFNVGFNVAEAVNFATAEWLSFGLKCAERYRLYGRRQAFAHNELICNLCQRIEILDLNTLKWLFESFLFIYKSHYEFIKTMLSANVTRGRPWDYDPGQWVKIKTQNAKDDLLLFDNLDNLDTLNYLELEKDGTGRMKYDDNNLEQFDDSDDESNADGNGEEPKKKKRRRQHEDAECVKCNHCIYIGCVRCKCDASVVCCHKHFNEFCQCPIANKWFEFRFNLTWFEDILEKLTMKVNAKYISSYNSGYDNVGSNFNSNININKNELLTDYSYKNYEILTKATDKYILNTSCNVTALIVRKEFEDRYGKILGDYSNQLVRKLSERFPRLSDRKMSQDELNHLRHACECVVWGHFNNNESNNNLIEVRRYFEILCDYNNVSKILFDAWTCYSEVQKFYTQLQQLQGQQDKIQVLLQNQPRFPKKLSLQKIQTALARAQNQEIKVDMTQITSSMPNILSFMGQQEQILQNALNGILSTTWECKHNLNIQARTIVNFIPGNFSHSYWTYLQSHIPKILQQNQQHHHNQRPPATIEDKNTCLVLPILKWLLGEFERGILASIDCDSMNSLKRVIRKGKKLMLLINKYYKNKNNECWLTQSQLEKIIKTCTGLHLRVPFWDFIVVRNNEYTAWNKKVLGIIGGNNGKSEKVNYENLVDLVKQYREYRIFSKNGDILKSYISPIKKWINTAKSKLLRINECLPSELHELLLLFERYTSIITDPPQEYEALLQHLGISPWIESVYQLLNGDYIIGDMAKINELIEIGQTFKIKKTSQNVDALRVRLNTLHEFYTECDEKLSCLSSQEAGNKKYDLNQYKQIIQRANDLKIDIKQNEKLITIQSNIDKIEEWQQYLKTTISKLPLKVDAANDIFMNGHDLSRKNKKKRTLSEFEGSYEANERSKYMDGAYKRRRKNNDVAILCWQKAIANESENYLFDTSIDYKQQRVDRRNETEIINELRDIIEKSSAIPVRSELETLAKTGLISIEQCVNQCNAFLNNINNEKAILMQIKEDEIVAAKQNAENILNKTLIEFKVSALHWRWHALRYLADIQQSNQKIEEEEEQEKKEEEEEERANPKEEADVEPECQDDVKQNVNDINVENKEGQPVQNENVDKQAQQTQEEEENAEIEKENEAEMKDVQQAINEEDKPAENMETDNINNIDTVDEKDNADNISNANVDNAENKAEEKQNDDVTMNIDENAENKPEDTEEATAENKEKESDVNVDAEIEANAENKQEEDKKEENKNDDIDISMENHDNIEAVTEITEVNNDKMEQDAPINEQQQQEPKEEAEHRISDIFNHWSLRKLFIEGSRLALNSQDIAEWDEISLIFHKVNEFEQVSIGLLADGNVDCTMLLSANQRIQNQEDNVVNIIKHSIGNKMNEYLLQCLTKTILQIEKVSARINAFLDFYNQNFVNGLLTHSNLEILMSELDLLSQCIRRDTIPYFSNIEATSLYMNTIFGALERLFMARPHMHKCDLIAWINFLFMQFNIMYRNGGVIEMDKYRSNNINNCYCFCRFNYTQQMREQNEEIPDMIGCDECCEWYHAECIMLDEKQMKKFLNTKKQRFLCPRCCYYEYNDTYKFFPSLHWNGELVKLADLEDLLGNNIPQNVIVCNCDVIAAIKRLVSWVKMWQKDVNNFLDLICAKHQILSDFNDEEIFIVEYLLNCGQMSGIYTLELLTLKILMRFIGKSTVWNNHEGVRQLNLDEIPICDIENKLLPKYKNKSKLLTDFMRSICEDIKNSKIILHELYIDLYLIKSIGIHYTTHMRRKKKGPLRVKLILQRLQSTANNELNQCIKLKADKVALEQEGDQYVNAQFEEDNRWLKYVNDSISMKKCDKTHFQQKWVQRLNLYKDNLLNKYKASRLQIQSIVLTIDLLQKLMEG